MLRCAGRVISEIGRLGPLVGAGAHTQRTLTVLKTVVDRALLEWVRAAIWAGMVLRCMHVLPEQFGRILVRKQVCRRLIGESAGAIGFAA